MTSRERFEEWHIEHVSRKPRLDAPKGLCEDDKKAWAAWQEAERQALERAATVCDEYCALMASEKDSALLVGKVDLSNAMSGEPRAAEFLAKHIRAMIDSNK